MNLTLKFLTWIGVYYEIDDPFFGRISYQRGRDPVGWWLAERPFGADGRTIELLIDAPAYRAPPTEAQRAFFSALERDAALQDITLAYLRQEIAGEGGWRVADAAFVLTSFSIPLALTDDSEWELTFETPAEDDGHLFSVHMRGRTPVGVSVDG